MISFVYSEKLMLGSNSLASKYRVSLWSFYGAQEWGKSFGYDNEAELGGGGRGGNWEFKFFLNPTLHPRQNDT